MDAQTKLQTLPRHFTMRQFSAAAIEFGEDRYGYVVSLRWHGLTGYFKSAWLRKFYSQASFLLTQDRLTAVLISLLKGVRVPHCPGSSLQTLFLQEVEHGSDRVILVGRSSDRATELIVRYDLTDMWHWPRAPAHLSDLDVLLNYIEFVERMSPFRFCFLCLGSPYDEMIAYCLKLRGVAKGLAICVGNDDSR